MAKTKDIRAAVEAELRVAPVVDAAGITVNNIGGNVALNGTVPSYPQYPEAAAAARRVAGVTSLPSTTPWSPPPGWPTASPTSMTRSRSPAESADAYLYLADLQRPALRG